MKHAFRDDAVTVWPGGEVDLAGPPADVDRRASLMRSALVGAAASSTEAHERRLARPRRVKKAKGPVMTTGEEFYEVVPGPPSSHTIGPMRITYDIYQRCAKRPADLLAKATASLVLC